MLSTVRASSDIRLGSQGGSHTMSTLTGPTPGTLATAFSTMVGSSCADGQLGVVTVEMTLTTPNCPSAQELPTMVENAVASVPGVGPGQGDMVWDPPWAQSRMSE